MIQLPGHKLASGPCGYSQAHGESLSILFRCYFPSDGFTERVFGGLFEMYLSLFQREGCCTSCVERTVDFILCGGIDQSRNLGDQSCQVGRTTSRAEPWRASPHPMIERFDAIRFEGIEVEETVAFEIDSRQHIVEQGYLSHVHVFGIFFHQEHAMVEKDISHRCTCLVKGFFIREVIFRAESFNAMYGPQTAGDMHPGIHNIMPDTVQGRTQARILCIDTYIGHS